MYAEAFHDLGHVFQLPNMVAHDARKSIPVRLHSSIGDQLVVDLPRDREVCHAVKLPVPERPTAEPVDGGWRNPKPALARAAPYCLLVGAGPAKNLTLDHRQ